MANKSSSNVILYIGIIIALVIGVLVGHSFSTSSQASPTTTTPPATTSASTTTTVPTSTTTIQNTNALGNSTVVEVLYSKETVAVPPPTYNPYYNYVVGCYWTSGWYNFSFYAPYPGYVVFNETNTGLPTNVSYDYLAVYFSTEKPFYYKAQPNNESSFCPGEIVVSNIKPWTQLTPYDNQTMVVPVQNGTNYVIFDNGNANQEHGVNAFPINVTFSMTYHGFKGFSIPSPPNTTTQPPNTIPWSEYFNRYLNHYKSQIPTQTQNVTWNYTFTKVFLYGNITNSSVGNFRVYLSALGGVTPEGTRPAIINIYYNNTLINTTSIFPHHYASFNASGNTLKVYVNQTDALGASWATFFLTK